MNVCPDCGYPVSEPNGRHRCDCLNPDEDACNVIWVVFHCHPKKLGQPKKVCRIGPALIHPEVRRGAVALT